MFTGLIQAVGEIAEARFADGDLRLAVTASDFDFSRFAEGESIAVSGVCLTALSISANRFEADVSRETLAHTTLGQASPGTPVNLEPAMALGERLGGHLVTGHVDCTGEIVGLRPDGRSTVVSVRVPNEYKHYIARKGSVALDGISLTVNAVSGPVFEMNIIPHTLGATTLGNGKVGDRVNIEVDLMARYLERFVASDSGAGGISREFLEKFGHDS